MEFEVEWASDFDLKENITIESLDDLIKLYVDKGGYPLIMRFGVKKILVYDDYIE